MARARIRARSRALRYAAAHLCCVAHGCPCLCSRRAVHHRHCLQDHSGAIDDRELKGFFAALGVQLSDKEVSNAMKDIDESGDNNVGFEEMIDWLQAKGVWDEQKIGLPCAPSRPLNRLHSTPSSLARSLTHSLTVWRMMSSSSCHRMSPNGGTTPSSAGANGASSDFT